MQGASYVIGVLELAAAIALIAGAFNPIASALGAAMSCATYLITLSFFVSTPGVAEPTAGGFPAISAPIGQFLLKDLVLLAASVCLLLASVRAVERGRDDQGNARIHEPGMSDVKLRAGYGQSADCLGSSRMEGGDQMRNTIRTLKQYHVSRPSNTA